MSLRFITAGESHGPGLTAVVEGLPAGLELRPEDIDRDLARRQLGHGRGGRMKIEKDRAQVTAGVRHGRTLGSPVSLWIENRDYQNWEERMNPWPVDAEVEEVHLPRPGHADLAGIQKFGHTDVRNVLERASRAGDRRARGRGRARQGVPARARRGGALARHAHRHGHGAAPRAARARRTSTASTSRRCAAWTPHASAAMVAEIDAARKANESLGGVFEVIAFGLVPGIGSHVSWEERLDGRLAQAIMSIQALKGVGIGDGFDLASGSARRRTTRSSGRRSAATTARPTAPAASRAA